MQARDWLTDCRTLFNRQPCTILSAAGAFLCAVFVWYASRTEAQVVAIQETLQQIQIDVAVIRVRQAPDQINLPAPGGGIAMNEADK